MPTKTEVEWTALHLAILAVREEILRQGIKIYLLDPMDIREAAKKYLEVTPSLRETARDNLKYQEEMCKAFNKSLR